jgi:hypothetical protein
VNETAIAVIGTLAGAGLTGFISLKLAAADRRDRRQDELTAALAAFGFALDQLRKELDALPPQTGPANRHVGRALRRSLPTLDWWLSQFARHTVARPALRAYDGVMAATNRLLLVAPEELLTHVRAIIELLDEVRVHDDAWQAEWVERRADLFQASRAIASA